MRIALALALVAAVPACGSATPHGQRADAATDAPAPLAWVALQSKLGGDERAGTARLCARGTGTPWIAIGETTGTPIPAGQSYDDSPIGATCTVQETSDGAFSVMLAAAVSGNASIIVPQTSVSKDLGTVNTGIAAMFASATRQGDFEEADCTFDFGGQPADLDPTKAAGSPLGIEAGRIWGNLTCPSLTDPQNGTTCLGQAELHFENCVL
jgi:hypothetical protein